MPEDISMKSAALDAARWLAVETRDEALVPPFRYGVLSTGIVCRPACPSRRPARRAGVQFFDTADEAVAAGFRACRRCRPSS